MLKDKDTPYVRYLQITTTNFAPFPLKNFKFKPRVRYVSTENFNKCCPFCHTNFNVIPRVRNLQKTATNFALKITRTMPGLEHYGKPPPPFPMQPVPELADCAQFTWNANK